MLAWLFVAAVPLVSGVYGDLATLCISQRNPTLAANLAH